MSVISDVSGFPIPWSKGMFLSTTFRSGASQLLAFRDDSDESEPEFDCSERKNCSDERFGTHLTRPYTRHEQWVVLLDTVIGWILGLSIPVLVLGILIPLAGALFGFWSASTALAASTIVMMTELFVIMPPGIFAWAGLLPDYPDNSLDLPEEELSIAGSIYEAWQENDLRTAFEIATGNLDRSTAMAA